MDLTGCIILPTKRCHSNQGVLFPWKGLYGLQLRLGRWWLLKKPPHEWQDPRFLSRTLPKASYCLHWLAFFLYHILVPGVPQISNVHTPGHPRDVKENVIYQARPPSTIYLWCGSTARVPIYAAFDSWQRSARAPWQCCFSFLLLVLYDVKESSCP